MIFSKNKKPKIVKNQVNDMIQYFIDYNNQKDVDKFYVDFLRDFLGDNHYIVVIDTDKFYEKNSVTAEKKVEEWKRNLKDNNYLFHEILSQKEADFKLMGIKVGESKNVNSYQIGVVASSKEIEEVALMVKDMNIFFYLMNGETNVNESIEKFREVNGNYDILKNVSSLEIYHDGLIHRFRIHVKEEQVDMVERALSKYDR